MIIRFNIRKDIKWNNPANILVLLGMVLSFFFAIIVTKINGIFFLAFIMFVIWHTFHMYELEIKK